MIDEAQLIEELSDWCGSYVRAFEAFDVPSIGAHWAFPAVILSGDHQVVLKDAGQFDANTKALVEFYRRQDVASVKRSVTGVFWLRDGTAAMTVEDRMFTSDQTALVEWQSAYVLRQQNGNWRAIFADANGEVQAWEKRGTPLGS